MKQSISIKNVEVQCCFFRNILQKKQAFPSMETFMTMIGSKRIAIHENIQKYSVCVGEREKERKGEKEREREHKIQCCSSRSTLE